MRALRVLVVDDHPPITAGLVSLLRKHGLEPAGVAGSPDEAVRMYDECMPDVVLMDIAFNHESAGLDAASQILAKHPMAAIIFYSTFDQDELIHKAYKIGGRAFITKDTPVDILIEAIKKVATGQTHFLPAISERLAIIATRGYPSPQVQLEEREMRVFKMIAQNMTNQQIVTSMRLSSKTISLITQSIKKKLNAQNNGDLMRIAYRHRVVEP